MIVVPPFRGELGVTLLYPDYRSGLAAILETDG